MKFRVIGTMSGTSLDGLDVALCHFEKQDKWTFEIVEARTFRYPAELEKRLRNSLKMSVVDFVELHKDLGVFTSNVINENFNKEYYDFIATHGHTVVHFPEKNINYQIGNGATIAGLTRKPVVCDFRSVDVALNGQGAPLVPIGDKLLFDDFDTLLNIGGFANASFKRNDKIFAYDISPANYALNYFAKKLGKNFDEDGKLGRTGICNNNLLRKFEQIEYYKKLPPKSLSDHWFFDVFLKAIENSNIPIENILATVYEHIAIRISSEFAKQNSKNVLVTGGGAFNKFLIEKIKSNSQSNIILPNRLIIEYKEALIFAFLGVLRWLQQANCLADVTGAEFDNIGGAVYFA